MIDGSVIVQRQNSCLGHSRGFVSPGGFFKNQGFSWRHWRPHQGSGSSFLVSYFPGHCSIQFFIPAATDKGATRTIQMSRDPPGSGKMFLFLNRDISTRANIADTGCRSQTSSDVSIRGKKWGLATNMAVQVWILGLIVTSNLSEREKVDNERMILN